MTTMPRAMPEATVLYSVTAVVVAGLVVWVLVVLKMAKEPWARVASAESIAVATSLGAAPAPDDVPVEATREHDASAPPLDADSTARATPVALAADGKAKAAKDVEKKADEA